MKWLSLWWYQYLFEKPFTIRKIFCRIKGHPNGPVWYNPEGLEPNMCCRDCSDYLG